MCHQTKKTLDTEQMNTIAPPMSPPSPYKNRYSKVYKSSQVFVYPLLDIYQILSKGQLISKCLFGVFTFFQKMNENKSTSSKVELVYSFFGRNVGLKKSFRISLTFRLVASQQILNYLFQFMYHSFLSNKTELYYLFCQF